MNYQIKRVNPYWHSHPMIPTLVIIGGILGATGYFTQRPLLAGVGAALAAIAILLATRPALSALLMIFGLLGGLASFIVAPGLNASTLSSGMRLFSTVFYALIYMILTDAVILVMAVLYNFIVGVLGAGGIVLDLTQASE